MAALQATSLQRGDRVELTTVPGGSDYERLGLSPGERGAVDFTDSLGTVHVRWDKGQRVGIIDRDRALICRAGK